MSLMSESGGIPAVMPMEPAYGNGGNSGWGDNSAIWLIILFLIWGGNGWGGGFGAGNGGASGALTRADLCQDMNFSQLENGVRGIQQGICDSTFALNGAINGVGTAVMQGVNTIGNAICNSEYQNAQLINGVNMNMMNGFNAANIVALQGQNALATQLADCCCKNQSGQQQIINSIDANACQTGRAIERGFCDTNYNQATNTTAIIQNAHNDTDRVLAKLDAMEMSRKDEVIADLRTQLAQCGDRATADSVVARLTNVINPPAVPAYPAASPCGLGNWAPQVLANCYGGCGTCG